MIGLSTKTYDIDGDLILAELPADSNIDLVKRRMTKTRTLDGGVVVEDRGYTSKDRGFTIRVYSTIALRVKLLSLIESHNNLTLTMEDGAFDVAPISFDLKKNIFILNFEAR